MHPWEVTTPRAGRLVTPLDVLDDYFGELPDAGVVKSLTLSQIDDLGDRVNIAAAQMSKIKPTTDPIGDLVYPGGWLGNGWRSGIFRHELNCSLLYEPRLLVHDPLAEYFFSDFSVLPEVKLKGRSGAVSVFGARMWANHGRRVHLGDHVEAIRFDLESIFLVLKQFEPLIRSGVMVMRSQFPILEREQHALEASVRADLRSEPMVDTVSRSGGVPLPRWDNLRGMHVTPPGGLLDPNDRAQWKPEFYYLAKSLMFSHSAGAMYAPASANELTLLETKSAEYLKGKRSFVPSQPLVEEVFRTIAPEMRLDPATAVKVRSSEEAFDAWRRELRALQRASVGVADDDMPQLVTDMLQPKVEEVRKAVLKSDVLRSHAPKNLALALISGIGALPGGPAGAFAAAATSGVGGYLMDRFGRRQPDGSKPVIAALLHQS